MGLDRFTRNIFGKTALHDAAERGNLQICEFLLSHGLGFQPDKEGQTPLQYAVMNQKTAVVRTLLELPKIEDLIKHIDINAVTNSEDPVLDIARRCANGEIVDLCSMLADDSDNS